MKTEKILNTLIERFPSLASSRLSIAEVAGRIVHTYKSGGVVLVCGNGGSAADSEHIVGELMKGFLLKRQLPDSEKEKFGTDDDGKRLANALQGAIPAISLVSQSSIISAYANDADPYLVYAQQVYGYGKNGKALLIAISTSGNSENVFYAAKTAKALGNTVISITGEGGGRLHSISDICLRMPARETARVQEYTLAVYHAICAMAEEMCFGE